MTDTTATLPVTQTPASLDRARMAVGYDAALAELQALATRSQGITEITNKAGRQQCHAAMMALKNRRIDIDKAGKEARADARAYADAVIAVADELIGVIEPEEKRLAALRDAFDEAEERARREREEKARAAVQHQQDAIRNITGALGKLFGASVPALTAALAELAAIDLDDFDDTYRPLAEMALADARKAIEAAIAKRRELDRQAAELAERQRQADIEAQERAERQRQEDEAREAERVKWEAEEARRRRVQGAIDDLARAGFATAADTTALQASIDNLAGLVLDAETFGERLHDAEYARSASLGALQTRLKDAIEAAERAKQAEIERQAEQARADEARRAEEVRVQREEAKRAQERAQAENDAIAAATLRSAAEEALVYLQLLGEAGNAEALLLARKLDAALVREPQA